MLVLFTVVIAVGCATTPGDNEVSRRARACDLRSNCFNARRVHNFEILDDKTIVVLVGGARCAYLVKLEGFLCNVSMSPYLSFEDRNGRICAYDQAYVRGGPFVRNDQLCRVFDVTALSDDELLEVYVEYGQREPLPAAGSGELTVEEGPTAGSSGSDAENPDRQSDDTTPARE